MQKSLGSFGMHPDISTDFCLEVERLEGWIEDIRHRRRSQWPFWARLSALLKFNRSDAAESMDEIAQQARVTVEGLERRCLDALPEGLVNFVR